MVSMAARAATVADHTLPPAMALDEPWVHIARDLLFAMGPVALAAHGACAIAATVVYRAHEFDDRRFPAVSCLVACIIVTAVIAAVKSIWWMVSACILWAVLSGLSAYRQFGFLRGWVP